jgi:hypothetical protein
MSRLLRVRLTIHGLGDLVRRTQWQAAPLVRITYDFGGYILGRRDLGGSDFMVSILDRMLRKSPLHRLGERTFLLDLVPRF